MLDLVGIAQADGAQLHAGPAPRPGLRQTDRSRTRRWHRAARRLGYAGRHLFEQLEPVRGDRVLEYSEPSGLAAGRAMVATKPEPTGSMAPTDAIGTVGILLHRHHRGGGLEMDVGASAARPHICDAIGIARCPSACRSRIAAVHPAQFVQAYRNPTTNLCPAESLSERFTRTPTRRTRSCARAPSGQRRRAAER